MKRGEIWEADLAKPVNRRPILILSRDSMPAARPEITVAYLSTKVRHSGGEVLLLAATDGVRRDCVDNLDAINTVSKSHLLYPVCTLSDAKMQKVAQAIQFALDLP